MKSIIRRLIAVWLMTCMLLPMLPQECFEAKAAENWQYTIGADGNAQVLGYSGPETASLTIPSSLGGGWVTSIAEGAFVPNTALKTLTIPGQVVSIAENAVPSSVTIQGYTGSEALRYAGRTGQPCTNLSAFDLYDDFVDLSDMKSTQWSLQDGSITLHAPHAARVIEGSRVFLPPSSVYPQGLPVKLSQIERTQSGLKASWTELVFEDTVETYHAEDLEVTFLYDQFVPAEGVSVIQPRGFSYGVSLPNLAYNVPGGKAGFTLEFRLENFKGTATVDVDYEFGKLNLLLYSLQYDFDLIAAITGEKESEHVLDLSDRSVIDKSFRLGKIPFQAGVVSGWVELKGKFSANGEIELSYSTSRLVELKYADGPSCNVRTLKSDWGIEASVDAQIGPAIEIRAGLGFQKLSINLICVEIFGGVGIEAQTAEHGCVDLGFYGFISIEGGIGLVDVPGKKTEKSDLYFSGTLWDKQFPIAQKHWEVSTKKIQDECTYGEMCEVSIETGVEEDTRISMTVEKGTTLPWIPDPAPREEYEFTGWYVDAATTTLWNFSNTVEADMTLYAGWEPAATPTPEPTATPAPTATPSPAPTAEPEPTPIPPTPYPVENIPDVAATLSLMRTYYCNAAGINLGENYDYVMQQAAEGKGEYPVSVRLYLGHGAVAGTIPAQVNGLPVSELVFSYCVKALAFTSDWTDLSRVSLGMQGEYGNEQHCLQTIVLSPNMTRLPAGTNYIYDVEYLLNTDNVRYVDNGFFAGGQLRSISLPNVEMIGEGAFSNCTALETVELGSKLTSIEKDTFGYCTSLREVSGGSQLEYIHAYAFSGCSSLESVEWGSRLKSIGDYAFYGCSSLREIGSISQVESIGSYAFYRCRAVTFGNGNELHLEKASIGGDAFSGCDSIKKVFLGSATSCTSNPFNGMTLTEAVCPYSFEYYPPAEKLTLIAGTEEASLLQRTRVSGLTKEVVFEDYAFTNLAHRALRGSAVEKVTLPEGLQTIGSYEFENCIWLQEINFPSSLNSIGDYAFSSCTSLTKIELPVEMDAIGSGAFQSCHTLNEVILPRTLDQLGTSVFQNCSALRSLFIYCTPQAPEAQIFYASGVNCIYIDPENPFVEYLQTYHPEIRLEPLGEDDDRGHTLILDSMGGSRLPSMKLKAGTPLSSLPQPVWGSRQFDGWCYDWHRLEKVGPNDVMPDDDLKLYAAWIYKVSCTIYTEKEINYLGPITYGDETITIPTELDGKAIGGLELECIPEGTKKVILHAQICDIKPGAFRRAADLTEIEVDPANQWYYAVDGVLYSRAGELVCYPAAKAGESFEAPYFTTAVQSYAFSQCAGLQEVSLPAALVRVDEAAFDRCGALERMTFASDPEMNEYAIRDCMYLWLYGPAEAPALTAYADQSSMNYNIYVASFANGGEVFTAVRVKLGSPLPEMEGPAYEERVLRGWSLSENGELIDFSSAVMPAGNLTLHAVWDYEFSFEATEDGVRITAYLGDRNADLIRVPETINGVEVTEIAEGIFEGMSPTLICNKNSIPHAYAEANGLAVSLLRYTLTFETNGGSEFKPVELCRGEEISLPATCRTGCTLLGWYVDEALTIPYENTPMPAEDMTLYASWSEGESNESVYTFTTVDDGVIITGYTGSASSLNTPATINNVPVVGIGDYAFAGNTTLVSVQVNDGVKTIGRMAFANMKALQTAYLPATLESLGEYAFSNCTSVDYIGHNPGECDLSIGAYAFANCSSMTSIYISQNVCEIDFSAFSGCSSLNYVEVDSGNMYYTCSRSKSMVFTKDGSELLYCPPLARGTRLEVPAGVKLGQYAFNQSAVAALMIPDDVTEIHPDAFRGSTIRNIYVMEGSYAQSYFETYYPDINVRTDYDLLYGTDGTDTCIILQIRGYVVDLVIPETIDGLHVNAIANQALAGCSKLESLYIGDHVQMMETGAINNNPNLKSVRLPQGITELASFLFSDNGTRVVEVPASVTTIGTCCFAWSKLTEITIPAGVTSIAEDAFLDCTELRILRTVRGSTAEAFFAEHLPDVTIVYLGEEPELSAQLVLPASLTAVAAEAFTGTPVVSVECPQGLVSIGSRAFADCAALEWIIIPASVSEISSDAFDNCANAVIYGTEGSYAQEYALKHDLVFRAY